jgi:antitoxin ParD1/3/4
MNVDLPIELERLVQQKIASGRYRSAEEVISNALLALEEQDHELTARAKAFKTEIARRLASGPSTPIDFSEIKRRIRAEVEATEQNKAARTSKSGTKRLRS